MLGLVFASLLLTPGQTELPTRVLTLPLESSSVPKEALAVLDGRIAKVLAEDEDLEVITQEDLKRMAELEAERAALGCDSDSCLAEIAGALGADLVVYGRVAKLGEKLILQLNMFDATKAGSTARDELEAADLEELAAGLPRVVAKLVAERFGRAPPPAPDGDAPGPGLFVLGGGGAVAAAGAVGVIGMAVVLAAGAGLFFLHPDLGPRQVGQLAAWVGTVGVGLAAVVVVGGAGVAGVGLVLE